MDFEDILKEVGGYGLYQKLLVFAFLIPSFIVIPWFTMSSVFINNSPDYWCNVPEVAHSNLSTEIQKHLIRPQHDRTCSRYDVNYTQILESGNWSVDPSWPTRTCDNGWQFDKTNYDATSVTEWKMVCKDGHYGSLVLSLMFFGDALGTPLYGWLSDRWIHAKNLRYSLRLNLPYFFILIKRINKSFEWGRRPTFLCMAFLIAVTEIGSVISPYFALFLILRTINGASMSTLYVVGYIVVLELVNPDKRARMNALTTTSWTLGLCLLSLLAYLTRHWIRLSLVTSLAAGGLLLYWKVLPESPSWLISQERYEEAAKIMAKISKVNGEKAHEGNQLLEKIKILGEKEKKQRVTEEKHSPLDFFRYPTLRKRFLLVTICWVGNSIPYFGLQMNVKNLAGNEFLNFFLISLVEVPSHISTWLFMERIGRRWCSVSAFVLSTVACILPVVFPPEYASIGVVASLLAKFGTSSAFMTLYQQGPELYPTELRGVGLGMSCTVGTGSNLIVPYIVYLAKYDTSIPFFIFAVISFLSAICATFLPETLNKRLPLTVEDAENFQKNQRFFSCGVEVEEDPEEKKIPKENTWSPLKLSAIDLSNGLKKTSDPVTLKKLSVERTSNASIVEIPSLELTHKDKQEI